MSYWTGYAVDGMYLTPDELELIRKGYEAEHGQLSDEDWEELALIERELDLDGKHINLVVIEDDCCDGLTLYPYVAERRDPIVLGDTGIVVEADNQPDPFTPAYTSVEVMRQEFVDKLGKYLPKNFDWESRMGHFQYACYA